MSWSGAANACGKNSVVDIIKAAPQVPAPLDISLYGGIQENWGHWLRI